MDLVDRIGTLISSQAVCLAHLLQTFPTYFTSKYLNKIIFINRLQFHAEKMCSKKILKKGPLFPPNVSFYFLWEKLDLN